SYAAQDKQAREEWISVLEALFLTPAGLSINDIPPDCSSLLAGFCSLADWLGSWTTTNTFLFNEDAPSDINALRTYFQDRQQDASRVLELSGLVSNKRCYEGV
ncbi:HD domain-containing protein, partial [Pseudomonas aeruginosa]